MNFDNRASITKANSSLTLDAPRFESPQTIPDKIVGGNFNRSQNTSQARKPAMLLKHNTSVFFYGSYFYIWHFVLTMGKRHEVLRVQSQPS